MKVDFYESQLYLLDKAVDKGSYGKNRESVLCTVLLEHAKSVLAVTPPSDRSVEVIEVEKPDYGKTRYDKVLDPVTGVAEPVYRGEILKIMQVEGGTCADFNAYNLHDYKEHLNCGMTRFFSHHPTKGDFIWTNSPRSRPMYAILELPETCKVYITGHRCNALYFEKSWGFQKHTNCQSTFAEAIREWGLTPDDTHDSFNLWMNAEPGDPKGIGTSIKWNPARSEDSVEFLALFDTLAVPIICGSTDITDINNYRFNHIQVQICESSASSINLTNVINERISSYKNQLKPIDEDFKVKDIQNNRELERDSSYKPDYIPIPEVITLDVKLTPEHERVLQSLMTNGNYGESEAEALIIAFIRWYNSNYAVLRTRLSFRA
ncbi:DUF1989 domain-containing protein [Chloroflexota bacterium]